MKLYRAIGILYKLRYNSNLGSHLLCSCQLWRQTGITSLNQIHLLQSKTLRKLTFKKLYDSAHSVYKELSILKFQGLIFLQNCLFMLIEQNESLAASFPRLKYCG